MLNNQHVIIVGGGIIGCMTAFYLAKAKVSVTIVERDAVGSQASGGAAGLLTPYWAPIDKTLADFSGENLRLHADLHKELPEYTNIDYHYGVIPFLRLAFSETDEQSLSKWCADRRKDSLSVEWLSAKTAQQMSSWIGRNVQSAVLSTIEPQVDAYPLTMAIAQASEYHGAKIISAEVTNVTTTGSRITGVCLHDGRELPADSVVLAMGPWSHFLKPWVGFHIPVKPQRGQILYLDSPHKHPEYALIHNDSYILPKLSGRLFAGTTWEDVGFSNNTTQQGQEQIIKNALYMSPLSQEVSVMSSSACLRPLSEDNYPFIGQLPSWDNLYIAAGHGPEGILLSPATGKYLSEIIMTKSSAYDISPFSPNRLAL